MENTNKAVGLWAKKYYLASRTMIESILRPFDLGSTQWYVLYHLIHDGPLMQRDLALLLQVERATLSSIITTLVKKGFISQVQNKDDQRLRELCITPTGRQLWQELPDPINHIITVAFADINQQELEITAKTLKTATERLNKYLK